MPIQVLPEHIRNKIAAGEVIERPASVVKELVENCLDAGAASVSVEIEEGGHKLIRVSDDGCGIPAAELPLAVKSHATSKLHDVDDLFRIRTLGFRGEALASAASVSQLTLASRARDAAGGFELHAEADRVSETRASAIAQGTTVSVRNLFFNTPARRKFLKSPASEMAQITETLARIALGWPEVHFRLSHNGRAALNLPPAAKYSDRIGGFFGADLLRALVPIPTTTEGDTTIRGYLARPDFHKPNLKGQFFFLNRRFIRDKLLTHALRQAYHELMPQGRFPVGFVYLDMDPASVDVNVHPAKIEVRFHQPQALHHRLVNVFRQTLTGAAAPAPPGIEPAADAARGLQDEARALSIERAIDRFLEKSRAGASSPPGAFRPRSAQGELKFQPRKPSAILFPDLPPPADAGEEVAKRMDTPYMADARPALVGQFARTYLVLETPEGLCLVDQHALHERLLYAKLSASTSKPAIQRLLVPETVSVSPAEMERYRAAADTIKELGFDVTVLGERELLIQAVPQIVRGSRAEGYLRDILETEDDWDPANLQALREAVHRRVACRAAVKAGDRLGLEEMQALLEAAGDTPHALSCPHGRPIAFTIPLGDIERRFERE